jgi:hypothetical protein
MKENVAYNFIYYKLKLTSKNKINKDKEKWNMHIAHTNGP